MNDAKEFVNIILEDFLLYLKALKNIETWDKRLDKSFSPSIHCYDENNPKENNNGYN